MFTIWSDTYVSHYYPNIAVHDSSPETTFQQVTERLEKLAKETDSFIAIQHQDPTSEGTTAFLIRLSGKESYLMGFRKERLKILKIVVLKLTILYLMDT